MEIINIKEKVTKIAEELPSNVTFEDALERLFFLYKIEKGMLEVQNGETILHKDIVREAEQWFK